MNQLGILGRTFNQISAAIQERRIDIADNIAIGMTRSDARQYSDSIFTRLGWDRLGVAAKMKDVDSIPLLDESTANATLTKLQHSRKEVEAGTQTWNGYFSGLDEGEKRIEKFVKTTNLQTASTKDVMDANVAARQEIITYNESLKATTLSAKATTLATKALAVAGNMLLSRGAALVLQAVVKGLDDFVHRVEHAKNKLDEFNQTAKEGRDALKNQADFLKSDEAKEWEKLSKGVDDFGNSIYLSAEEMDKYHSISNKIADMFPDMVQGWDDQGNAILSVKGDLEELNAEYKKTQDNFYQQILNSHEDVISAYKKFSGNAAFNGNKTEIEAMERFINNGFTTASVDGDANSIIEGNYEIDKILDELGIDDIENDINQQKQFIRHLETLKNTQNAQFSTIKDVFTAYAHFAEETANLNSEESSIVSKFINSMDYKFFDGKTYEQVVDEIQALIDNLKDNPDLAIKLDDFVKLDKSSLTEAEYEQAVQNLLDDLKKFGLSDEAIVQIKLAFNIDDVGSPERDNAIREKLASALGINPSKNNAMLTKLVDDFKTQLGKEEIDFFLNPDNEFHIPDRMIESLIAELEKRIKEQTVELEPKVTIKARLEKLDDMSDAFKSLKTAMDEVTDDGKVVFSTIETLAEKLGDDVVEKYADTLLDASSSAEDLSKVLTSMTQDYIDARIATGELNDATENEVASMLDEAGIANAVEVAHDNVAEARVKAALAAFDNAIASGESADEAYEDAKALIEEADNGEIAAWALDRLTYAKERANAVNIDVATDVSQLRWLISTAEEAAAALRNVQITKGAISIVDIVDDIAGDVEGVTLPEFIIPKVTPTFKPSDASQKSGKSAKDKAKDAAKAQKDYDKKVNDINEQLDDLAKSEALDKLKYKFDQIEASITKIDDALGLLKTTLDLQAEDDYIGKIETVTYQMDLAQQKTGLLVDEFNQLKATTPTTADMAKEIADRMKSVTESIASNRKDMIDYAKSVTDYYMSAAKSIGSMQKDTLSKATSLFERNVKTLTEGGLTGLQFRLTPTVPQDAYKKQRKDNQSLQDEMQDYYDAVAKMQKTALDMQYQEQIADNERKRQELYESLEEAKQTLNDALAEATNSVSATTATVQSIQQTTDEAVKAELKDTNKKTSEEQKKDHSEKEAETENFSGEVRLTLTNLFDWIAENPIKAPGLDTSSWDKMVSDAESYASRIQNASSAATIALSNGVFTTGFNSGNSDNAQKLIGEALTWQGIPYKWGGSTKTGADCSGFLQTVAQTALGKSIPRTTYTQFKSSAGQFIANKSDLQAGDYIYFGKAGSQPHHVAMYLGDNKYIHAPQTGDVIKISEWTRSDFVGGMRFWATGTETFPVYGKNPNGVVSENHKPETIMHKKTGKTSIVDEPALIDTREYDIIGEKQTAEILKNQHANGTFDNWNQLSLTGGLPKLTVEQIQAIIDNTKFKYSSLGKSGSAQGIYNAQQKTGVSALATLAFSAGEGGWANSRVANEKNNYWGWGHYAANGKSAFENAVTFSSDVGTAFADYSTRLAKGYGGSSISSMAKKYSGEGDGGGWATLMTKLLNQFGTLLQNKGLTEFASASSTLVDNTGETASNTANTVKILRQDFKTRLQSFLNGTQPSETDTNKWEDDLLSCIKENVEISSESNEKFIEMWDKMQAYQDENTEVFKALDQKLLDAVGTDEFASVRNEIAQITDAYTNTIIGMQSDLTTEQFKVAYAQANDVVGTIRAYFNQRKAEDAGADELKAIADALSEAQEIADGLSDDYVAQIQNQTDYLISMAERVTKPLADELSWLEKTDEELERQQELTSDISEQFAIMSQREDNYSKQLDINRRKQEAAHQAVLDMNSNENYKEILRRFDIETWFDANAEFTEQFTSDLERMALTMPELVPYMKQYAEQVQVQRKAYYEAGKAIEDLTDKLSDIGKQKAETNVDVYVQVRERVQEHTEFKKSLNDAKVEIQQAHNDFIDSLREEQNAIDAELEANKHLSEWLSEDTRKQLFNDADWAEETAEIARLREKSEAKRLEFQEKISNLREDEQWQLEGITAEYNKQMDALQDQLSIAKQKLQTAKDQAAIENAMRERDTQIIMGNRVQNVADPDKLYDLEQKAQQSRLELINQETKSAEAAEIRDMQRVSDDLGTIISNISYMTQAIERLPEKAREIFAMLIPTTEDLEAWLHSMDRDSVYSIINDDLTESAFMNVVDLDKTQGFSQIYDHSAGAETIARDIVEGLIADSDLWRKAIYGEMQNHDNKNLVDPYHTGYSQYGVGEWIGTGKRLMDTYPVSSADELAERERIEQSARELLRQSFLDEWDKQHAPTVISGEGDVEYLIDTAEMKTAKTLPNGTVISSDYQQDPNAPHTIETTGDLTISGEGGIVINGEVLTPYDWTDMPKLDLSALAMPKYDIFTGGNLADIVKAAGETNNDYSKNFHIDRLEVVNPMNADDVINGLLNQTDSFARITNNMR